MWESGARARLLLLPSVATMAEEMKMNAGYEEGQRRDAMAAAVVWKDGGGCGVVPMMRTRPRLAGASWAALSTRVRCESTHPAADPDWPTGHVRRYQQSSSRQQNMDGRPNIRRKIKTRKRDGECRYVC